MWQHVKLFEQIRPRDTLACCCGVKQLTNTQNPFLGCLIFQQHTMRISRLDLFDLTCCHIDTLVADQTCHLTQSLYTDTRPTSLSTDPITPGVRQSTHKEVSYRYDWADDLYHKSSPDLKPTGKKKASQPKKKHQAPRSGGRKKEGGLHLTKTFRLVQVQDA